MNQRRQYVIEEFPVVDLGDIRRAVGGRRKLRKVTSVTVDLPDGRSAPVSLVRAPANIAGSVVYALCRRCGHRARTLRIVPTRDALVCAGCVKALYSAKYTSQITMRASTRSSIASGEADPRDAKKEGQMAQDSEVYGRKIQGTSVVECGRCGQHVDMTEQGARRRHKEHHLKLDELEEATAIDPLRHDECVRIEAMKDAFLGREDLVMQARGVVELLVAEYSRYVMKEVASDRPVMMFFDDFVAGIDLDTRFAEHSGLADAVREEMDKPFFGYRPTRAMCRGILGGRMQERERQIQSELCSATL